MWKGDIPANLEDGKDSEVHLKHGDIISVVATGYIKFGPEDTQWSDPAGPIPLYKTDFKRDPALVAMIGSDKTKTYPIGTGVLDWHVPHEGVLTFKFVDKKGEYRDNEGSFVVEVTRETEESAPKPKPVTYTLEATNEQGVKSGVTVSKGDKISITVTGKASYGGDAEYGPDGDGRTYDKATAPDLPLGAVIMQIGSNPYRLVGSEFSGPVQDDGDIVFLYNDTVNAYGDNKGSFSITLTKK